MEDNITWITLNWNHCASSHGKSFLNRFVNLNFFLPFPHYSANFGLQFFSDVFHDIVNLLLGPNLFLVFFAVEFLHHFVICINKPYQSVKFFCFDLFLLFDLLLFLIQKLCFLSHLELLLIFVHAYRSLFFDRWKCVFCTLFFDSEILLFYVMHKSLRWCRNSTMCCRPNCMMFSKAILTTVNQSFLVELSNVPWRHIKLIPPRNILGSLSHS